MQLKHKIRRAVKNSLGFALNFSLKIDFAASKAFLVVVLNELSYST